MLRVALVGANGQVGAELCLLLSQRKDIQLVPICRNRSGSAFLRWRGIACRHGRVADPTDASRLLGDCDVVVNSSLASGSPAKIRRTEAAIARNLFACSKNTATIIHFSTQSVYGDPTPGRWIRWRNPYGRAKRATERRMRQHARLTGKPCFILRLGHVCGAMQEISHTIRTEIAARRALLPALDRSSNTVYTAAIVEAIDRIINRQVKPGTFDLMNTPRWTWQEVYEFEALTSGLAFEPRHVLVPEAARRGVLNSFTRALIAAASAKSVRDMIAKAFAYAPESIDARAMAWWYASRARTEIAQLEPQEKLAEHLFWVENGKHFFPAGHATSDLLRRSTTPDLMPDASSAWISDLPDAHAPPIQCLMAKPVSAK